MADDDAERATVEEGKKVAQSELAHFMEHRDSATYWSAMRTLTFPATWGELRGALSARLATRVNDNTIRNILRALRDAGIVVEGAGQYAIGDPMTRAYVRESARPPASSDA